MGANKIILHFTLHSFMYINLKLYAFHSKIFQSLILFQKKKASLRLYVEFYHVKTFAVELKTVKVVEIKVKKC